MDHGAWRRNVRDPEGVAEALAHVWPLLAAAITNAAGHARATERLLRAPRNALRTAGTAAAPLLPTLAQVRAGAPVRGRLTVRRRVHAPLPNSFPQAELQPPVCFELTGSLKLTAGGHCRCTVFDQDNSSAHGAPILFAGEKDAVWCMRTAY